MRDYSGFNRDNWKPRSSNAQRKDVDYTLKYKNRTEQAQKESEVGCRYSVLVDLPYFVPIRMLIIDTMHILYLGYYSIYCMHGILPEDEWSAGEVLSLHLGCYHPLVYPMKIEPLLTYYCCHFVAASKTYMDHPL